MYFAHNAADALALPHAAPSHAHHVKSDCKLYIYADIIQKRTTPRVVATNNNSDILIDFSVSRDKSNFWILPFKI